MFKRVSPATRGGLAKNVVFAGLAAGIVLGTVPAKAEVCADPAARAALELRVLQSEFMVSALTCGQKSSYNAFVTTFEPFLKMQGGQLRSFFTKAYGPKAGAERLNRTVTRLANVASQNSLTGAAQDYCSAAKARFTTVLKSTSKDLALMARTNPSAKAHGYTSCVEMANRNGAEDVTPTPQGVN